MRLTAAIDKCATGLSSYALNDADEAETFLQLAARWASSPTQQLQALSNLGMTLANFARLNEMAAALAADATACARCLHSICCPSSISIRGAMI